MAPKIWLPVIVVFFVVLLFAGLRLTTEMVATANKPAPEVIRADSNWMNRVIEAVNKDK